MKIRACIPALAIIAVLIAAPVHAFAPATELKFAVSTNDMTTVKKLLKENPELVNSPVNKFNNRLVHITAADNNMAMLLHILEYDVDLDKTNNNNETALIIAAGLGNLNIVRVLAERGANLDEADKDGETALHKAAGFGRLKMVKVLVDGGAALDPGNENMATPLIRATTKAHYNVVKLLLDRGADPTIETKWKITALKEAQSAPIKEKLASYSRIAELLQKYLSGELKPGMIRHVQSGTEKPASAAISMPEPEPEPEPEPVNLGKKDLRIKVLSGDGIRASAIRLTRKLMALGYIVDRIDMSKSKFEQVTIYYGTGIEEHAQEMADSMGGAVLLKPLSWKSGFHIIAVSAPPAQ